MGSSGLPGRKAWADLGNALRPVQEVASPLCSDRVLSMWITCAGCSQLSTLEVGPVGAVYLLGRRPRGEAPAPQGSTHCGQQQGGSRGGGEVLWCLLRVAVEAA